MVSPCYRDPLPSSVGQGRHRAVGVVTPGLLSRQSKVAVSAARARGGSWSAGGQAGGRAASRRALCGAGVWAALDAAVGPGLRVF